MAALRAAPEHGLSTGLRLGLTGGIGSGKSTVAQMLVRHGAVLIDSDAIARTLTLAGGAAMSALLAEFGPQAIAADGSLDRGHMRQRAFADADVKRRLEAVLHPLIGAETARQAAAAGAATCVFDVPLLAESSHWRGRVHRVLVVDCLEATQIARVVLRPGWDEEGARRVLAQQAGRSQRRAMADAVIYNEGLSLAALAVHVQALASAWGVCANQARDGRSLPAS